MQARLTDHLAGVTELQHQRLLGLVDGEQRIGGDDAQQNEDNGQRDERCAAH